MSEKNSEGISEVKAQGVLTTALGKSTTDRQIRKCRWPTCLVSLELPQTGQCIQIVHLISMGETCCSTLTFAANSLLLNQTIKDPFRMYVLESSWVCPFSKPCSEL